MAERAIELLALPDDNVSRLLLDIGCGSGLSGEVITEMGHNWIGVDISESMLSGFWIYTIWISIPSIWWLISEVLFASFNFDEL